MGIDPPGLENDGNIPNLLVLFSTWAKLSIVYCPVVAKFRLRFCLDFRPFLMLFFREASIDYYCCGEWSLFGDLFSCCIIINNTILFVPL